MSVKKRLHNAVAWSTFIVCTLLLACHTRDATEDQHTLHVALVLPLTGDLANYGKNAEDGIELAAGGLNSNSENKGTFHIQLFAEDSKGLPQDAVSALQKLISADGVTAGHRRRGEFSNVGYGPHREP